MARDQRVAARMALALCVQAYVDGGRTADGAKMKVIVTCRESDVSLAMREYADVLAHESLRMHRDALLGVQLVLSVDSRGLRPSVCCEIRVALRRPGAFAVTSRGTRMERAIAEALSEVDGVLRFERRRARRRLIGATRGTKPGVVTNGAHAA